VSDRLALANAITDAGIPRDKAERVASVIVDLVHDTAATKGDVLALGAHLKASEAAVRAEIARLDTTVKAQPNAIMLRMGGLMVVVTGVILAALRYLPPPGHAG